MTEHRPIGSLAKLTAVTGAPVIACPACNAAQEFHRKGALRTDACGFECYSLECKECGAPLAGIVDPFDNTLLLSLMVA